MAVSDLQLESGTWVVANCGSMPSESNCKVVMLAPEDQKDDLVAAGVKHAVDKHGHEDTEELRSGIESTFSTIEV